MKKTRALLLTIVLLTITFASCNLDGTSGIFRSIADSKAPLSISYKQLLGIKGTHLYFHLATGVERILSPSPANSSTPVATNANGKIIQNAALSSSDTNLFYITNDQDELTSGTIHVVDTAALNVPATTMTATSTHVTPLANSKINNLYANSMVMVEEKDQTGEKFELLKYNNTTAFDTSVATFTLPTAGYGLHAVIQQTTKEQDAIAPMIVSFAKGVGDFKHYFVDPFILPATPVPLVGFDATTIASFMYDKPNDKAYVLTTDGSLYFAGTLTVPAPKVLMKSSGKSFDGNAFAYLLKDTVSAPNKFHIVTKPSLKTSSMYVFTFPENTVDATAVSLQEIKSGYAKELSLASIVSAQLKSSGPPTTLLVATDENGMYDISINNDKANLDTVANGTSSAAEDYTF